jgi:hypothetical protein
MFQFTPLAPICLWIQQRVTRHDPRRVSPFGHLRIKAYVRLPEAFRSLSRPSSPVRAKASTVRPSTLDRICLRPGPPLPRTHLRCGALPQLPLLLPFPLPVFSINSGLESARIGRSTCELLSAPKSLLDLLQKGGDPAAGSPTATLLRLRPSHRARLRPLPPLRVGSRTSGAPDSHGVTGGVYKARERIHRGVADPRLLAIPASCSRVTDCNPNLDQVFAIRSASRPRSALSWPL